MCRRKKNPKQVGCEIEEKEIFWSELDEVMESIPTGERVVIGADFNGHVGEENTGDEEVMGKLAKGTLKDRWSVTLLRGWTWLWLTLIFRRGRSIE
ncbi:hypothetical protein QTP70_014496 [Hemibagrus guttatus]|uniref:Craniofacial development protein 2-like n=1 Tax=Hemibagrus guttatus TaxID=175788 RepID=A0AAE0RCB4_9TELE|nr:hypothetical protein QTP70_014496 [Hemibagrus guttatus]